MSAVPYNVVKLQKWDSRYLGLAKHIGDWSKDPNAKVGAVIVNQRLGRIISVGFNGFPSNVEDDAARLSDGELKLKMVIHAKQNALLFAGREARDCDIYVVGKPVCNHCAILLIQAGVKRVVAAEPMGDLDSKWHKLGALALDLLKEAKVEFCAITDEQLQTIGADRIDAQTSGPEQADGLTAESVEAIE